MMGVLFGICVITFWSAPDEEDPSVVAAKAQMMTISTSLKMFRVAQRELPTSEEGLGVLVDPTSRFKVRKSFIFGEGILDPWDVPFGYSRVEHKSKPGYDIWSAGPDKVHFTDDYIIYRVR